MRKFIIIICWTSLVLNSGISQRFESINNDLPFSTSRVIYQDDYGFLWFGTTDGLIKYDGYSITEYRKSPNSETTLPGSQVNAILQISEDLMFIGFESFGLSIFNRNTGRAQPLIINGSKENQNVNCLYKSSDGKVWIGTDSGIYVYEKNEVTPFPSNSSENIEFNSKFITAIFEDTNKNLWIGTSRGIHLLTNDEKRFYGPKTNTEFPDEKVMSIIKDNDGQVWVSFRNGKCKIYKWNSGNMVFDPDDRYCRDGEFSIIFDLNNNLWASSHGRGIYHFKSEEDVFYSDKHYAWHGMRGMFTNDIYYDKYQNIWVESDEVYKLAGNQKQFFNIDSDQFQVISVYADDEHIWYCSNEPYKWPRDLKVSDPYMSHIQFTELMIPDRERDHKRIYQYKEWGDSLIFTSIRNAFIWNKKTKKLKEYPTSYSGAFREFIIDINEQIWVPGYSGNPLMIDLNTGVTTAIPELNIMKSACAVVQAPDGKQWWGTHSHGLFSYDPITKLVEHYSPDSEDKSKIISSYSINDIHVHSDGSIWVGTKFGLNHIDPKTQSNLQYNFEDEYVNTNINSILEDEEGTLWLGTESGLLHFNQFDKSIHHYTKSDGIINTNFTPRSCYKDNKGCLYFGGNNGIDYFFPKDIKSNPIPPDLYIKQIKVNGTVYCDTIAGELLRNVQLMHHENFVEIELTGLHFVAPEAQEYAYNFNDQDTNWISLGNKKVITLARLSPGNYSLHAKCANPDGYWSEPKMILNIEILPPFWKTPWFIALFIGIFLFALWSIYKFRISQIRKTERLKTEFNKRIAEIELKALRAQMNPHFLFNSLNSVRLLVDKGDKDSAKHYLTKFSQLIREVLENSKSKLIRLDHEVQVLLLYLELEKMRFKNFKYTISIDEDVEADFIEIPPMLMQPYVENAIWHGLMNKEKGERCLDIHIKKEHKSVIIEIEDNGIGRKQSALINSSRKKTRESLGLKISKDRINLLKDIYGREASVQIIDLQDPSGTKVVIRIPSSD